MIVMIGINLLNLKKIKTANFLPAFILEILFVVLIKKQKKKIVQLFLTLRV